MDFSEEMFLAELPWKCSDLFVLCNKKEKVARIVLFVGIVVAFLYWDASQKNYDTPEVSDSLVKYDLILRIVSPLNAMLHNKPESVVFVAAVIIGIQYLLLIALIVVFFSKGNMMAIEECEYQNCFFQQI